MWGMPGNLDDFVTVVWSSRSRSRLSVKFGRGSIVAVSYANLAPVVIRSRWGGFARPEVGMTR